MAHKCCTVNDMNIYSNARCHSSCVHFLLNRNTVGLGQGLQNWITGGREGTLGFNLGFQCHKADSFSIKANLERSSKPVP